MPDTIEIRGLAVTCHLGVPDAERATPQQILFDIVLEPLRSFNTLPDRIEATVDYAAVAAHITSLATSRPRHLIETLADETATSLLRSFALKSVTVTIRKFILPDTECVAVRCTRSQACG